MDKLATAKQLREAAGASPQAIQRRLQFPVSVVPQLCVEAILRGHSGCVNRLAWNEGGTLLASGSDDRQIMLWRYPDTEQPPMCIDTLHQANIFGIAFLPGQDNRSLISGAMDYSVQLHRLEHSPTPSCSYGSESADYLRRARALRGMHYRQPVEVSSNTVVYNCHRGRVKMVEVEPGNSHMFWSASEDGCVRQFDTRCPGQAEYDSPNVLLTVKQKTRLLDLLALRINKVRPYQMAVASTDPYVRIYDRRMLNTGGPESATVLPEPVLKMAPPHMCLVNTRKSTRSNTTHVSFGARGDRIVASYHADHAYSFDISGAAEDSAAVAYSDGSGSEGGQPLFSAPGRMPKLAPATQYIPGNQANSTLPHAAEAAKMEGNRAFFDHDDNTAIWHYTRAIQYAPDSAVLYANRAAALLKREWLADAWSALQDCETAIRLDPLFPKAHCRRAQALIALGQLQAAKAAANTFAEQFPLNQEESCCIQVNVDMELEKRQEKARQSATRRAADQQRAAALERSHSDPPHPAQGAEESVRPEGDPSPMQEGSDNDPDDDSDEGDQNGREAEGWLRNDEGSRRSSEPSTSERPIEELLYGDPRIAGQVHRLLRRFVGHCNVQTDIKEACFLGGNDELVAAGSDDGRVFIYNADTGYPLHALQADEDVANCVQPHPTLPVLATSGIESVIRLWRPGEGKAPDPKLVMSLVSHNQERLKTGTNIFRTVTPRVLAALTHNPELLNMLLERARPSDTSAPQPNTQQQPQQEVTCRMS